MSLERYPILGINVSMSAIAKGAKMLEGPKNIVNDLDLHENVLQPRSSSIPAHSNIPVAKSLLDTSPTTHGGLHCRSMAHFNLMSAMGGTSVLAGFVVGFWFSDIHPVAARMMSLRCPGIDACSSSATNSVNFSSLR